MNVVAAVVEEVVVVEGVVEDVDGGRCRCRATGNSGVAAEEISCTTVWAVSKAVVGGA